MDDMEELMTSSHIYLLEYLESTYEKQCLTNKSAKLRRTLNEIKEARIHFIRLMLYVKELKQKNVNLADYNTANELENMNLKKEIKNVNKKNKELSTEIESLKRNIENLTL